VNTRELLDKIAENVSVRRSFGAAYEHGNVLVVPVALVLGGGGGGEGPNKPTVKGRPDAIDNAPLVEGKTSDSQPPTNTGGGFGGLILPMGVYVLKDDQVSWVPARDVTLVVLAALSAVRVSARLLQKGRQRRAALRLADKS
jgi:uncharacterized spore protein YtfJ